MPDSRLRMVVILSVIAVVAASGPGAMAQFDADGPRFDVVGRWDPGAPSGYLVQTEAGGRVETARVTVVR